MEMLTLDELKEKYAGDIPDPTQEEADRIRELANTATTLSIECNMCDIEILTMLASDAQIELNDLATKIFQKGIHDFAVYIANVKLNGGSE